MPRQASARGGRAWHGRSSIRQLPGFRCALPACLAHSRPTMVVNRPGAATRAAQKRSLVSSTTSRLDIFHEGGNLHELDAGAHTVETAYPVEQLISEERFGGLL